MELSWQQFLVVTEVSRTGIALWVVDFVPGFLNLQTPAPVSEELHYLHPVCAFVGMKNHLTVLGKGNLVPFSRAVYLCRYRFRHRHISV